MTLVDAEVPGLVVREGVPLAERTTLRIGGPARYFAEAATLEALTALLGSAWARNLPVLPLGKGSNVLIDDEGFPGVAFLLTGAFRDFSIEGTRVVAGGGCSLMGLAVATKAASLSGLENLSGIPSSFGGAIRINAGSYGSELFEMLVDVTLVDRRGVARTVPAAQIAHGYRWTALIDTEDIVAGGTMELVRKPKEEIDARFALVTEKRKKALPKQPNAGSIFKNPEGDFAGRLLEACGLKGRRVGNAEVSTMH
ncbi:MAG TPA: FAD-binding protein, partial [Thermoanaerobaculia bacterium]|nr:FAD-binding protein [Thermoanaerobaculia bacterium]